MPMEMRSSNAIVCPAGQNGRTDELSLFPSVESFMKAQGATSTPNTLQRRPTASTASQLGAGGITDMERSPTSMSLALYNKDELAELEGAVTENSVGLHASLSRFHQLRKQSDLAMIRCIQEDESHRVYFMRPPLSQVTLFFIDAAMEKVNKFTAYIFPVMKTDICCKLVFQEYRARAHQPDQPGARLTLASPTYNTYLDILVSAVTFVLISLSCLVHFEFSWPWGVVFFWGSLILIATSAVFLHNLCREDAVGRNLFSIVHNWCTRWYSWHVCGALLMSLPVLAVMSNFSCRGKIPFHSSIKIISLY